MQPDKEAPPYPSVVAAAAELGVTPALVRYHLREAGQPPMVHRDGRAYLTMELEEARQIIRERQQLAQEIDREMPGLGASRVALLLRIQPSTVYRLRQLGYLPADWVLDESVHNQRRFRWSIDTVKRYARRRNRELAEELAPVAD